MKSLKYWVHVISQIFLIISVVVFIIPAILSIVNFISPIPAGELGGDFQRLLASLSVICYGAASVPMLPELLLALTVLINIFDIVWRYIRGHRFNKKQVIYTAVVLILGVLGLFSVNYIIDVYTATVII